MTGTNVIAATVMTGTVQAVMTAIVTIGIVAETIAVAVAIGRADAGNNEHAIVIEMADGPPAPSAIFVETLATRPLAIS